MAGTLYAVQPGVATLVLKLCGRIEWKINSNHPIIVLGDYLADLKAIAEELGIPFECYDYKTPEERAAGENL